MINSFVKYAAPLLNIGVQIQNTQWDSAASLQEYILEGVAQFSINAESMSKSNGEVEDAKYALLAFLDELILKNSTFGYEWLEYRLMMKIFNEQLAGENYFKKVDQFLIDDTKNDLLELYGVCILLGFQGKYQLEGLEGLQLKIKEITEKIYPDSLEAMPELSSFSDVPTGAMPKEKNGRSYLLYSIGVVIVSCIAYMSLVTFAQM